MNLLNKIIFLTLLALLSSTGFSTITETQKNSLIESTTPNKKAAISDQAFFGNIDDEEDDEVYQSPAYNIETFFDNRVIDEDNVLALNLETKGLKAPNNSRLVKNNNVTVCRYNVTGIGANGSKTKVMAEMQTTSPSISIYPGAMVKIDQEMLQGKPRIIDLDRAPINLTIENLPGLSDPNISINEPSVSKLKGVINGAISRKVDEFHSKQDYEGYGSSAANSQWTYSKFHSSSQVAAELGFNYKALDASVSASLDVKNNNETTTIFALFKQVFYKVSYQPPYSIHSIFSGLQNPTETTLDRLFSQVNETTPAGYISQASYGQMILVRMTFNEHLTEAHAKAKAQALVGAGKLTVNASADYLSITKGVEIQITAIGGNSEYHGLIVESESLEEIKMIISRITKFNRSTPGSLISYAVNFLRGKNLQGEDLKDKVAKVSFTSDYVCKECQTYSGGFVELVHHGAYVADFSLKYSVVDPHSKQVSNYSVERKKKTSGFKEIFDLPGDAYDISINGKSRTGLVWQPFRDIFKENWNSVKRKRLIARGTSLNTKYKDEDLDEH